MVKNQENKKIYGIDLNKMFICCWRNQSPWIGEHYCL